MNSDYRLYAHNLLNTGKKPVMHYRGQHGVAGICMRRNLTQFNQVSRLHGRRQEDISEAFFFLFAYRE